MKIHKETIFLIIFCVIYFIINVVLYVSMHNAGSGTLEYVIVFFPIFWLISGILLLSMILLLKINMHGIARKILVLCSTPIPYILYIFLYAIFSPKPPEQRLHYYDNKMHQEFIYYYWDGKIERKEFYKSNGQFDWEKDSIWIYYDRKGRIIKTEQY